MRTLVVPKSKFKPKAFSYFRLVAEQRRQICITDHGKPVAKIVPYDVADDDELRQLRDNVIEYQAPLAPVGEDWEATT
jgi:prevent-host-death family protein